jgi:hypothetical protein
MNLKSLRNDQMTILPTAKNLNEIVEEQRNGTYA